MDLGELFVQFDKAKTEFVIAIVHSALTRSVKQLEALGELNRDALNGVFAMNANIMVAAGLSKGRALDALLIWFRENATLLEGVDDGESRIRMFGDDADWRSEGE